MTVPTDLEEALRANAKTWSNYVKFALTYRKGFAIRISAANGSTRGSRIIFSVRGPGTPQD